jgi:hypothetical protein
MRQIYNGKRKMPKSLNIGGRDFGESKQDKKGDIFHDNRKLTETEMVKHDKKLKNWKFDMKTIVDKAKTI